MKLWAFPIWVLMLAQANAAVFDVIISGSGGEASIPSGLTIGGSVCAGC